MGTLGPNFVKNLDFGLLLGIASYNSSDITHSDLIQWILSAIGVFNTDPTISTRNWGLALKTNVCLICLLLSSLFSTSLPSLDICHSLVIYYLFPSENLYSISLNLRPFYSFQMSKKERREKGTEVGLGFYAYRWEWPL